MAYPRRKRNFRIASLKITHEQETKELEKIRVRYNRILTELPTKLAYIRSQTQIVEEIKKMQNEGFKDWHILQTLTSILMNSYMHQRYFNIQHDMPRYCEKFNEIHNDMKIVDQYVLDPFPKITSEDLKQHFMASIMTVSRTYGFEHPVGIPLDEERVLIEIKRKCPFLFTLDIEHDDIFN